MKKKGSLEYLLQDLRRRYGKEAAQKASDVEEVERVSTGLEPLDRAVGGGWPEGRIAEIWGPQSAGKSTLVYRSIAACQKARKGRVALFDLENTFSKKWAGRMGVDLERLLVIKAVPAEDVGTLIIRMVRKKWPMVIIDSVVELIPERELKKNVDEESYAVVARTLSRLLPKIVMLQSSSPTIVLLVNQVRDIMGFHLGHAAKAPGGHALFHLDTIKIRVQRKERLEAPWKKGKFAGYQMAIRVLKSKVGKEGEECRLYMVFGHGLLETRDDADAVLAKVAEARKAARAAKKGGRTNET